MGTRLEKNSTETRKRIESHHFEDEQGEEYEASKFGGFTDYMRRKKIKLQNLDAELRSQTTSNPPIFRGIVAYVNGYTQPSLNDLHKLIVSYGGGFQQYLDGKTAVTHVIASNLTPKKKVEFAKYRIVKPVWVVDSVEAGKLLPWDAYRVVDEGVTQKILSYDNGQVVSQANNQRQGYRDQSETSWYTSQVRGMAQGVRIPEQSGDAENAGLRSGGNWYDPGNFPTMSHLHNGFQPRVSPDIRTVDPFVAGEEPQAHSDSRVEAGVSSPGQAPPDLLESKVEFAITDDSSAEQTAGGDPLSTTSTEAPQSVGNRQLTAEEHNARLLSNPHMAKSSTANPDFLNQYYRESRLHHLSTWKSDLKAQLQARAAEKASSQQNGSKRAPAARRYIMHVDFDSFFAAVSLRKSPQLADKPVVIAHGSGPGSEIASCNYPARKFGVKNGMWMKTALQLCPDIKVLPYDFKAYEEASRHFYDSILAVDGIVQSISIDEALVDVSQQCIEAGGSDGKGVQEGSIYREQAKATELAQQLRSLVKEKTGCVVSVGIGNNILLAKVALRKAKPAGQHLIKPEEVLDFIGELLVTDLPGVAWSIGNKLEEIGVKYVKDIRSITKERLVTTLGPKTGEKLWDYSRGIDKVEVGEQVVRKSVSAEVNWGIRFVTQQQAEEFVQCLCDELHKRLLEQGVKGRQLTMKIMRKAADAGMDPPKNLGHGKCDTFNKSIVLGVSTNDKVVLGKEAISILRSYGFSPGELRGLGVQMQKLEPLKPLTATTPAQYDSSQRRLHFKRPENSPTPSNLKSAKTDSETTTAPSTKTRPKVRDTPDPIEETPTPEKTVPGLTTSLHGDAASFANDTDIRHKPLNISGTQFLLPTQIDPAVLADLPADIKSKLAPRYRQTIGAMVRPHSPLTVPDGMSRSGSPFTSDFEYALPNQSQIDPGILQELPADVRDELLSHYKTTGGKSNSVTKNQQVLPQSPRKARPILATKKLTLTPTKKQRISTLLGRNRSKARVDSTSTLTQSNFVSLAHEPNRGKLIGTSDVNEISQSFLEELPEDIRSEILAEQRRNRLKTKAGLSVGNNRRKPRPAHPGPSEGLVGQRKLLLPPRSEKPTFTSRKLTTLSELRDAMSAWVEEFSAGDEDGPFDEDVSALNSYLCKVVLIEQDMEKAVAVVEWLDYLIGDLEIDDERVHSSWAQVIPRLREGIQIAVKTRGLPPVNFAER